jgi:hypothetical protein
VTGKREGTKYKTSNGTTRCARAGTEDSGTGASNVEGTNIVEGIAGVAGISTSSCDSSTFFE